MRRRDFVTPQAVAAAIYKIGEEFSPTQNFVPLLLVALHDV